MPNFRHEVKDHIPLSTAIPGGTPCVQFHRPEDNIAIARCQFLRFDCALGVLGMRVSIMTACLLMTGCSRAPPVDRGPSVAAYQKDIEDQLGITRARQRQEA